MSRIHEALQKAQQERLANVGTQQAAPQSTFAESVPLPPGSAAVKSASHAGLGEHLSQPATEEDLSVTAHEPNEVADITFEELASRCAAPTWRPDLTTMLFCQTNGDQRPGLEEFRTLRSRLYQVCEGKTSKTILVSSAVPGEGKSFVAANLSQAIVRQHGRRALLIDADLRRPNLDQSLGAPSSPGLSEYLAGKADEVSIVQKGVQNLFFIPAGTRVSNPAELIANARFQHLLRVMSRMFEWTIVDGPPAVPVADPAIIARHCDGVILVVNAGSTAYDAVDKARKEFKPTSVLGVVLNRVEAREMKNSYYNYGYYDLPAEGKGNRDKQR
jgi:protein-tyrosine kinase